MRRIVVDPGTVLSWFAGEGPGSVMRREYEAGVLTVIAPRRIMEDVLGEIGRHRDVDGDELARIAAELPRLGIQLVDPPLPRVAAWLARGLDGGRAPYAALAAHLDVRLSATDADLRRVAVSLLAPDG